MVDTTSDTRLRKVTGAKVYASDYRPRDLAEQGWPADCAHALLLRSRYVDRPYRNLDLTSLPAELRPDTLVTAADLPTPPYRNWISTEAVQALLPEGEVADYLGQPVAIAIYSEFMRFRRAAQELREDAGPVVYGPPQPVTAAPGIAHELGEWTHRRYVGAQRQAHYLLDGTVANGYSYWSRGGSAP